LLVALSVVRAADANGTWDFVPQETAAPLLDLRHLNEDVAGQSGFVRRSEDGNGFVRGDGAPLRFWPVQTSVNAFKEDGAAAAHARWLARLGVNLARLGGGTLNPRHPGSRADEINAEALDATWRGVAALKQQGIYSLVMPYWVAKGSDVTEWGIDGYTGKSGGTEGLWGLLFFNPTLQAAYRGWLKEMMTKPNPYTGLPLAQDPAVAVVLLQNEDSLLFWTVSKMQAPQQRLLGERFAAWAVAQYGSLAGARQAWDGAAAKGDDAAAGVLGLYHIYDATVGQSGGKDARLSDQIRFFTETMRRFNADTARYLREELGCRSLIAAENWKTADQARLLDGERYAYTACEVIAKNHYFGGAHVGSATVGYRVRPGDRFTNRSVLTEPRAFPVNMKQVVGHPHLITECAWVNPDLYQSEAPFLAAAYRSLTGQAGLFWFAVGAQTTWEDRMSKWGAAVPMTAGLWPAAALLYRKGYVKEAPAVVHEERPLEDLWRRKLPAICEDGGFDPNRDEEMEQGPAVRTAVDPLAFLVGRVEVVYGGDPAKTRVENLAPCIDADRKTVRSITGEIVLDYGGGVCRLDAPKAQGACGFLGAAGEIALSALTLRSENAYASILAVAMDDRPLAESGRILIQVGTTARPTGWRTEPAEVTAKNAKKSVPGERIVDVGRGPWQIENTRAWVRIANPRAARAVALDAAGAAPRPLAIERTGDGGRIVLPPDALYVIVSSAEDPAK